MTLPQRTLPAPGSDAAGRPDSLLPQPGPLLCEPSEIFDAAAVRARIGEAADAGMDAAALRAETVRVLREANAAGRAVIARAFAAAPLEARMLTRS